MRRAVLLLLLTLSAAAHAELTERVTCKAAPDQAYALYVPTKYDAAKQALIDAIRSIEQVSLTVIPCGLPLGFDPKPTVRQFNATLTRPHCLFPCPEIGTGPLTV